MTQSTAPSPAPLPVSPPPRAGGAPMPVLRVPVPQADYVIAQDVADLFQVVDRLARSKPQKVMLKGPHGAGKTELAIQFAARTQRPLLVMDCANLREPRDWFGFRTIEDGRIVWHTSLFARTLPQGHVVVLLDEVNRCTPAVCNVLNPLLDGRGATYLEELGEELRVGPDVVFFATLNAGAAYTGTYGMDAAMRDRWPRIIEVDYLPRHEEIALLVSRTGLAHEQATALVDLAHHVRARACGPEATFSEAISTRRLLAAAEDLVHAGPGSLRFTIANHFSSEGGEESERAAVLHLLEGKLETISALLQRLGAA